MLLNKLTIAVIIPTFNSDAFLTECFESVCSQLSKSKSQSPSIFFIDKVSTDLSFSRCISFATSNIKVRLISQHDNGPANAINSGLAMALADPSVGIIGWLNSDDLYHPLSFDRAIAAFKKDPKLKIVYGLGSHIDVAGKDLGAYPTLPPTASIKSFSAGSFICQPTVFFHKEVFAEVGLLDETLKTAFDLDLWLRIFKHYRKNQIGFINKVQ